MDLGQSIECACCNGSGRHVNAQGQYVACSAYRQAEGGENVGSCNGGKLPSGGLGSQTIVCSYHQGD